MTKNINEMTLTEIKSEYERLKQLKAWSSSRYIELREYLHTLAVREWVREDVFNSR